VPNSSLQQIEKCPRFCVSERRDFLKLAVGAIGGTASESPVEGQSQQPASIPALMFQEFKASKIQTTGAHA
jgi:hypothetical protein